MKPSIGRMVHYYDEHGSGPFAAIVVYVHADTTKSDETASRSRLDRVNLAGHKFEGEPFSRVGVARGVTGEPDTWSWPPLVK